MAAGRDVPEFPDASASRRAPEPPATPGTASVPAPATEPDLDLSVPDPADTLWEPLPPAWESPTERPAPGASSDAPAPDASADSADSDTAAPRAASDAPARPASSDAWQPSDTWQPSDWQPSSWQPSSPWEPGEWHPTGNAPGAWTSPEPGAGPASAAGSAPAPAPVPAPEPADSPDQRRGPVEDAPGQGYEPASDFETPPDSEPPSEPGTTPDSGTTSGFGAVFDSGFGTAAGAGSDVDFASDLGTASGPGPDLPPDSAPGSDFGTPSGPEATRDPDSGTLPDAWTAGGPTGTAPGPAAAFPSPAAEHGAGSVGPASGTGPDAPASGFPSAPDRAGPPPASDMTRNFRTGHRPTGTTPPAWAPSGFGATPPASAPPPGNALGPGVVHHVGDRPPTYEAEPVALPEADPDGVGEVVADTVLDGARYGACTLRAVSVRGDSARYRGEPRRDALLTARFGTGEQALVLVAMATGARAVAGAHRAASEACAELGRVVGRHHAGLSEDIRAGLRGPLKAGLHRLTDRALGRLRARAREMGVPPEEYTATLRCLLLPADPDCRLRIFFGSGPGGLFRIRGGAWQDLEPSSPEAVADASGRGGTPAEDPAGDRLTMELGIPTPPSPWDRRPDPRVTGGEPAAAPPPAAFRFHAASAASGDVLLLCSQGLAEPLHGEPALAAHLAGRWGRGEPPGLAEFLADAQVRVKGYADDRTAAAVWEA
ncbi:protein phosphatase 2C domain-containing protein [Streptomyces odontomachi]|uniref:protein phosphatase 2C domain-containing protein n=1 Tax=Streptomyces odontomachi TaxID=2944940 RepID=UPI00210B601B|nr:protein phosphatase 2C domain-containing protein [Streptomyces sp. ODS25]